MGPCVNSRGETPGVRSRSSFDACRDMYVGPISPERATVLSPLAGLITNTRAELISRFRVFRGFPPQGFPPPAISSPPLRG